MTAPKTDAERGGPANGADVGKPKIAPPPNPKIQAVTFALELAKIRAAASTAGYKTTDVQQLISDAEAIARFIGPATIAFS